MALPQKHQALRDLIAAQESVLVCFSGGVDSTLLLRVAHDVLGDRCMALIALSPTMAQSEQRAALDLAAGMGVRCETVHSHELSRPEFQSNPKDRCYYCKSELLTIAAPVAQRPAGLAGQPEHPARPRTHFPVSASPRRRTSRTWPRAGLLQPRSRDRETSASSNVSARGASRRPEP